MEDILHYAWKYRLFNDNLTTTGGLSVEVVDVGIHNTDQGPDFFNAKIKIDGELWAGNVEIHTSSDQWVKHKHHENAEYNSVILHVVERANCEIENQRKEKIPQCAIVIPPRIKDNYDFLLHSDTQTPCASNIGKMPSIHLISWMGNLLVERLERKSNRIFNLLNRYNGSWEEVFYIVLSRNFGFGLNSDSFERLAQSLPIRYLQKQGDSIMQTEALLFGQAGMLEEPECKDAYFVQLQKEYTFLSKKYTLEPLDTFLFKKLRVRPTAFPQIRIAQLANLIYQSRSLFSKIIKCEDIGQLRLMFHVDVSEYWQTHYCFGVESEKKSKYLGDSSLDIILINTVVPILFSYGKSVGNEEMCERAINFLELIKPEKNSITTYFGKWKMPLRNAADSQSIIQLRREYCELRKCLLCRIGHQFLASKEK